ncbi:MAG TPA: carboxymuconolactone decarboxylase family protein [Candidatus Nanopelagicales bacterium]|nr:carboxymuconolactone decarboxylase family protein [Candidatus Nanopelagicales bacterium]
MQAKIPDSVAERIESFCELRATTDPILKNTSSVYKQVVELNNQFLSAPQRKGGLSEKQKVLTLVCLYATNGTEQSIDFAVTAALQVGAGEEEILDALELALLTGGGSAVSRVQFATAVLAYRMSAAAGARATGAAGIAGPVAQSKDKFEFVKMRSLPTP